MVSPDIFILARRQFGVVSQRQLELHVGPRRSEWETRDDVGDLVPMLPDVYRLTSAPDTFLARAMAVHLWSDGKGTLTSWTAARIHGFRGMPAEPIRVSGPSTHITRPPIWVHVERTDQTDDRERQRLPSGFVVTTPAATLVALATDLDDRRFARAADDAWQLGLVTPTELAARVEAGVAAGVVLRESATRAVEAWLDRSSAASRPTRSGAEQELLEAIGNLGLPPAELRHPVRLLTGEWIRLPLAWPDIRLAVQSTRSSIISNPVTQDLWHDRGCLELGWEVIRLDTVLRLDPPAAARHIAEAHVGRTTAMAQPRLPPRTAG